MLVHALVSVFLPIVYSCYFSHAIIRFPSLTPTLSQITCTHTHTHPPTSSLSLTNTPSHSRTVFLSLILYLSFSISFFLHLFLSLPNHHPTSFTHVNTHAAFDSVVMAVSEAGGLNAIEELQNHPNQNIYQRAVKMLEVPTHIPVCMCYFILIVTLTPLFFFRPLLCIRITIRMYPLHFLISIDHIKSIYLHNPPIRPILVVRKLRAPMCQMS